MFPNIPMLPMKQSIKIEIKARFECAKLRNDIERNRLFRSDSGSGQRTWVMSFPVRRRRTLWSTPRTPTYELGLALTMTSTVFPGSTESGATFTSTWNKLQNSGFTFRPYHIQTIKKNEPQPKLHTNGYINLRQHRQQKEGQLFGGADVRNSGKCPRCRSWGRRRRPRRLRGRSRGRCGPTEPWPASPGSSAGATSCRRPTTTWSTEEIPSVFTVRPYAACLLVVDRWIINQKARQYHSDFGTFFWKIMLWKKRNFQETRIAGVNRKTIAQYRIQPMFPRMKNLFSIRFFKKYCCVVTWTVRATTKLPRPMIS